MGSDFYLLFTQIYSKLNSCLKNFSLARLSTIIPIKKLRQSGRVFLVSVLNYFVQHLLQPSTFSVGQFILARL